MGIGADGMMYVFLAALVGLGLSLVLGVFLLARRKPVPLWGRVVLVACLAAVLPFSVFGFLASFEGIDAGSWAFRLVYFGSALFGYGGLVLGSLSGIVWLCLPRRKKS
jgi:hypothetical protein